jgi:hypothetical protein
MAKEKLENAEALEGEKSIVQEFYNEKGAESLENISKGGKNVVINLVNKTMVEFTEAFGNFKKGHQQYLSDVAFAIYDKKGVVKKL